MRPRLHLGGLRNKIIAWSFVPTVIILVAVAVVMLYAYQDVTEDLVIERDMELTRLTADKFVAKLMKYADLLSAEVRSPLISLAIFLNKLAAQRKLNGRSSEGLIDLGERIPLGYPLRTGLPRHGNGDQQQCR